MVPCGTWQGYDRHRRRNEPPCRSCLNAKTALKTIGEVRSGRRKAARVPFVLLGELLRTAPPEVVAWAEEELTLGTVPAARFALEWAEQQHAGEGAA